MTGSVATLAIEPRYCGPPRSGNGGYVCGRVAEGLGPSVRVRLKAPPPIDVAMRIERTAGPASGVGGTHEADVAHGADVAAGMTGAWLLDGGIVVAEATAAELELAVPACPSLAAAERARSRYLGFAEHNFPTCFVCGPQRRPGDGLCIYPGALDDDPSILAAPWTPDANLTDERGRVRSEFVWAALDCPGAFTRYPLAPGVALVLGELWLRLVETEGITAGTPCIVIAWPLGDEGRRRHAGTALFRADGRLVAFARAIWVEVPAQVWS